MQEGHVQPWTGNNQNRPASNPNWKSSNANMGSKGDAVSSDAADDDCPLIRWNFHLCHAGEEADYSLLSNLLPFRVPMFIIQYHNMFTVDVEE